MMILSQVRLRTLLLLLMALLATPAMALFPDKTPSVGSCNFNNPFSGTADCVQYTGSNWTSTTAAADCGSLFTSAYEYEFFDGGVCAIADHAADCVEALGTADEKINENVAVEASFCQTLSGVCEFILEGEYFPVAGSVCDVDDGPEGPVCEGLEPEACAAMQSNDDVEVVINADYLSFNPLVAPLRATGVIFFPGGGVTAEAYAPLAQRLATSGLYMAILTSQAQFQQVIDDNSAIQQWVLAGHSLGGVNASKVLLANPAVASGLALLASFPDSVDDLTDSGLHVLSLYGTNDLIATPVEVLTAAPRLPETTVFAKLRGGNHAQFGAYGDQSGDGEAEIKFDKQQDLIAASIMHLAARVEADSTPAPIQFPLFYFNYLDNTRFSYLALLAASGFNSASVPMANVNQQRIATLGEFVNAQTFTTPGATPQIHIAQLVEQTGNPNDISLAPIIDGQVSVKMLSQERLENDLSLVATQPQGDCGDVNADILRITKLFLSPAELGYLDDWVFDFLPDVLYPTGPDFIADPSSVVTTDIDEGSNIVSITSPSFFANLDPGNGAAAGRHYCKSPGMVEFYRIIRQLGAAN